MLMRARCEIEMARDLERDGLDAAEVRRKAEVTLEDYLSRYPDGRFVSDAIGWKGAVASDRVDWPQALKSYLSMLEGTPTREVIRTALRECDRVFGEMLKDEGVLDGLPVEKLAAHPAAAMMFVYRCLDAGCPRCLCTGLRGRWVGWQRGDPADRAADRSAAPGCWADSAAIGRGCCDDQAG